MADDTNGKEFSLLEPYGHAATRSKFERYWESFKGPFSLYRERVPKYSVYAGMTYFPMEYKMRRFKLDSAKPTTRWIVANLKDFVRVEFLEHSKLALDCPSHWPIKIAGEIEVPSSFLERFLQSSEWTNRIDIRLPRQNSADGIASCIYDLLCDPRIGSSRNLENNDRERFVRQIAPTIENKSRILLVLPGFPFKDQNRFRVPFDASIPDIGEISFMIRLFNLTQILYQVHPHGVDVVVLTDGELYHDIFGVSGEAVSSYMKRLVLYRKRLNLQGGVSFLSLKELIDRSSDDAEAWIIVQHIRETIQERLESASGEIAEVFRILVSGMKWNLDSRAGLDDLDDKGCWQVLRRNRNDIEGEYEQAWHSVNERAFQAALTYAAVNLMLRWTKLVFKFFPDAIRGTVHPKPGQFALAGSGASFAWNGVATSRKWPSNIDDIRVIPYMSLGEFPVVRRVVLEDSSAPLFYTASLPYENIEAAKSVLGREEWYLDDIYGRELLPSDLTEFISLGLGDENFSWERKLQTEGYFTGLFEFRISHYEKYGFGIHGIWMSNKLIGQLGLQVYDENHDEIELVVFLAKEYTHMGLGSKLLEYVVRRCRQFGLTCLYGVVRPDNLAAITLLEKYGCEPKKTVAHFNQEGILYRII